MPPPLGPLDPPLQYIQYSLFRTKFSQDRNTVYKTQNRHADKKPKKTLNTRKDAIHIHTLEIYKVSLKQVTIYIYIFVVVKHIASVAYNKPSKQTSLTITSGGLNK